MKSFRALLIRNTFAAAALPLLGLTLILLRDQARDSRAALDRSLLLAATLASRLLVDRPASEIQQELQDLDRVLGVRLTVLTRDGTVLADTSATPPEMENHLARAEVQAAIRSGSGRAERRSETTGLESRYLAILDASGPQPVIYRAAASLAPVRAQVFRTQMTLLVSVLSVLLIAVLLAARLTQQLAAPVEDLSSAAARFSAGDPHPHVIPDGPSALRRLGETYNAMVDRISLQVRSLDEAQGYLDAVIRQMPEGLMVLDAQGTVTRVNAAAERLLGLPASRMLSRPVLAILLNYSLDGAVNEVLQGGSRGETVEVRTPEGSAFRVAVGPLVIGKKTAGAVMILEDVSELRRADEMRRDFVANVSHELRTPVASIRALVETLSLRSEKRPELLPEYAPRIVKECERIDRLVQDLLLLAQTEAGRLPLQPEPIHPRTVAEEVVGQVEPVAAESGTTLVLESFPDRELHADHFAVSQCIRNLVDNAVRYAAGGTVRIGARGQGDEVIFYVADDGPGIPAEDLPRIFERFYRVDKARTREVGGSGLGLSIVKHLADAQGGRAWAESRLGSGTTFFLAFPVAPAGAEPAGAESAGDAIG